MDTCTDKVRPYQEISLFYDERRGGEMPRIEVGPFCNSKRVGRFSVARL